MRQAATPAVTSLPRTRTEMELDHVITKHNLLVSHTHSRYYNHPIINFNNEFTQLYDSDYNSNKLQNNKHDNNSRSKQQQRTTFRHRINIQRNTPHKKSKFRRSLNIFTNNVLDQSKYITNLSSTQLTKQQNKVLSLGLGFIQTGRLDRNNLEKAYSRFERSNRIKHYFKDQPETIKHPFKKKSTWVPPKASTEIEQYLQTIKDTINDLSPKTTFPNLSQPERQAINELYNNENLIIKSADKGSGIVVEDRSKYIEAGIAHLSDNTIYEKIDSDPTLPLGEAINNFVKNMHKKGIIDNITKEFLLFPPDLPPRTQQLYFLKKIHKDPISERPIVSGCGGPTEKISQFIDQQLQPFVPKIKSYIKDSGHIIQILEQLKVPSDCILATIDVKSLYLNIPHKDGIQAVTTTLYNKNTEPDDVTIPPGTMKDLLDIVLSHNHFQFNDTMYHQIQGTAMGTKMAPAYANIFMSVLEDTLLNNYHTKPLVWKRYIDDVLCIWPGNEDDLKLFIDYLNQSHPTIKFTYEHSKTSINFLDLTIYKGTRHNSTSVLDIKPYFKKTNKFQYLHYTSAHPSRTFSSIIKGELTRLLRGCSDKHEYSKIVDKMKSAFIDRGYPSRLVHKVCLSLPFQERDRILQGKESTTCPYDTFFVIEYTPDLDLNAIKEVLKPDNDTTDLIPKPCLSLKKTRTLRNKLVRAKLKNCIDPPTSDTQIIIPITPNLDGHSAGCAIPGCKCCAVMSRKVRITSTHNYKSFFISKHTNCSTKNVIYLLECTKCTKGNQYVGQTSRQLSQRIAGHRAASRIKTNLPIYKHFANLPDHSFHRDIKVTILEKTCDTQLDAREKHWINTLETVFPKGLNSRYEE